MSGASPQRFSWKVVAHQETVTVRSALALWRKLHAEKSRNNIFDYWQKLRRQGQLFELAADLEETVTPDRAAFRSETETLAQVIQRHVLDYLLSRLASKHGVFEIAGELAGVTNARAQ
jgi:hypothetical protein